MEPEEARLLQEYGFFLGAFALIFDDRDRVLLCLREDLNIWNLPGGAVEQGEAPWETAVRETKEEVGLDVEIERLAGIYWKPEQREVAFSFECRIAGGEIMKTWEAVETGYFAIEEMPERMSRKHMDRVRDTLENLAKTVMKTQVGPSSRELIQRGLI